MVTAIDDDDGVVNVSLVQKAKARNLDEGAAEVCARAPANEVKR